MLPCLGNLSLYCMKEGKAIKHRAAPIIEYFNFDQIPYSYIRTYQAFTHSWKPSGSTMLPVGMVILYEYSKVGGLMYSAA